MAYKQHMSTDLSIKRLRWIMLGAMLFDLLITLAGQPVTYWVDPTAAVEGNPVVRTNRCSKSNNRR